MSGLSTAQRIVGSTAPDREKDDFYPTPREATEALLRVEKFDGPIWECACGDGAISEVLLDHGYEVVSTDLVDRGYGDSRVDFLMEHRALAPNIVTNPPFKLAEQFVSHALRLAGRKVVILARLNFLEGRSRAGMFRTTPISRVWVFAWRLPFMRAGTDAGAGGGGLMAFAWFVWDHSHSGPPTLGWLE